ncbi:type I-E CRISPR-associated protein Cse1/CasA [Caballeronia glebae]|uniref:type I-E CRISPR-associated protein Cse1/CasA n=1 Tax=Caballeronia glebae TaxID=1777143 RepID=UPI0038B7AC96
MTLHYSLLDEPIIRFRHASDDRTVSASLPDVFVALLADDVHDFPSLRPHQRHAWHAFLVQLAAIAMHRAKVTKPFASARKWRAALQDLTPDHPDGAAWCLVSPPDRPALLQAPVVSSSVASWKNDLRAADELDILVTAKGHDLKAARIQQAEPDDWLFSLVSLQSQQGVMGAFNYGVSRMNGGYGSRPGIGVVPKGRCGKRWARDVNVLLDSRQQTVETQGFQADDGVALVWLVPWDGSAALPFSALDPHYIEICRRVRLSVQDGKLRAKGTSSKAARIHAKERNGVTGDAWTPVDVEAAKALSVPASGFNYRLTTDLAFGLGKWQVPAAQRVRVADGRDGLSLLAQSIARGQGKTEGYHERRIPLSPKTAMLLQAHKGEEIGKIARRRIESIAEIRKLVWGSLVLLFNNGDNTKSANDSIKDRASAFARGVERTEDPRFFDDLAREIEATDPEKEHLAWLVDMAKRSENTIRAAFVAGPRSGIQRYRAQSAALSRFHGGLRSEKSPPIPLLATHLRSLARAARETNVPQQETLDV